MKTLTYIYFYAYAWTLADSAHLYVTSLCMFIWTMGCCYVYDYAHVHNILFLLEYILYAHVYVHDTCFVLCYSLCQHHSTSTLPQSSPAEGGLISCLQISCNLDYIMGAYRYSKSMMIDFVGPLPPSGTIMSCHVRYVSYSHLVHAQHPFERIQLT